MLDRRDASGAALPSIQVIDPITGAFRRKHHPGLAYLSGCAESIPIHPQAAVTGPPIL
jgi:hypothetical protein